MEKEHNDVNEKVLNFGKMKIYTFTRLLGHYNDIPGRDSQEFGQSDFSSALCRLSELGQQTKSAYICPTIGISPPSCS